MTRLNQDIKDFLACLSLAKVEYLVVGAYSLAAHGYPRAIGDINFWINPTPENAERIISALQCFTSPLQLSAKDFLDANIVVQLGVAPNRIDLLTSLDGLHFDDAWRNKLTLTIDGVPVFVLSKEDLLTNKLATGRDKDQSDIRWLMKQLGTS
ncbi:MAG: DUF6036 family nucleotidyltransferase [Chloroherpetonaceae bacterium]